MKRLRILCRPLVCLLLAGCAAPDRQTDLAAFNPELQTTEPSTRVPLINAGNGQWRVRVQVNGKPALFVVDTGAGFTSITPQFAEKLGLTTTAAGFGIRKSRFAEIDTLSVGNADYLNFYAPVLNLDHINRAMHSDVAGILGNNVLGKSVFSIDWRHNTLTVDTRPVPRPANAIPLSLRTNLLYLTASLNGQPVEFALDTGAYRSVISDSTLAALHIPACNKRLINAPRIDIFEARQLKQTEVILDSFKLGMIDRKNYAILTWRQNALGMDLLEPLILTVNARENWVSLSENSSPTAK